MDQLEVTDPWAKIQDLEHELAFWKNAARKVEIDLENAEVSLRVSRATITKLKAQLEAEVKSGEFEQEIQHAFDYWREVCNHPRSKLDAKRATAIRNRFAAGHSLDDLKEAIDGAADSAYVDPKGVVHDDIELICRDEVKFDSFRRRRQAKLERLKAKPEALLERLKAYDRLHVHDELLDIHRFKCPVCQEGEWPLEVSGDRVDCWRCGAGKAEVLSALP